MEKNKNNYDLIFERTYIGNLMFMSDSELVFYYNHMINLTNKKIVLKQLKSRLENKENKNGKTK